MPALRVKTATGEWLHVRGGIGPQGIPGPASTVPGPVGPQGPEGRAIRTRWSVDSALDLPAFNVEAGDAALVGTVDPRSLFVYTTDPTPAWRNLGPMTTPFAGTGVAETAARSDHNHDDRYSQTSHIHDASVITTGTLAASRIPGLDASKITAGTISVSRLPVLDAGQIGTGTLASARIPDLDGAKITAGTVAAARIASLDASKIATGTLADARIPELAASKITSGTLPDARIPNLNASKVTAGTFSADRIPTLGLAQLFPNNATSNSFSTSSMRVAPGNGHSVIGTLGAGWGLHDTGYRRDTDELWAYVMIPGLGFCWIPANRI